MYSIYVGLQGEIETC